MGCKNVRRTITTTGALYPAGKRWSNEDACAQDGQQEHASQAGGGRSASSATVCRCQRPKGTKGRGEQHDQVRS